MKGVMIRSKDGVFLFGDFVGEHRPRTGIRIALHHLGAFLIVGAMLIESDIENAFLVILDFLPGRLPGHARKSRIRPVLVL